MKTNTLLTYILYALLIGLVLAAGYQACRMQQQKKQNAEQEAELQQTLRNLGYADTTSTGSSYVGGSDTSDTAPSPVATPAGAAKANAGGIEDDPTPASSAPTSKPAPATPKGATPAQEAPKTSKTTKNATKSTAPSRDLNADTKGGRYQVRVGSFSVMDNARDQLEKVIKMGYQQAEIGKINNGKYATVVVVRTNNLAAATAVADKLEDKGIDALVYDTVRKKGAKN